MPTASRRFSFRFAGVQRCCASQDERQRSLAKQRVTGGNVAAGSEPSLGSPSFCRELGGWSRASNGTRANSIPRRGLWVHGARGQPQLTVRLWALTCTVPDGPARV